MKKITGGLYFLYDKDSLVYIGKSSNIFYRIGTHIHEGIKQFDNWDYQVVEDEKERGELEGYLINIFNPKYNQKQEYNNIFNKDKNNHIYNYNLNTTMEAYKIINEYDYIPLSLLDEIFGISNMGNRLYLNNYLPQEVLKEEIMKGYTTHRIIKKTWILENIHYLLDCVQLMEKNNE